MEIIDVMGRPCPIPVIESKKALTRPGVAGVIVKVDNIIAVQNLEKMAYGCGYSFSYQENSINAFEVTICPGENSQPDKTGKTEPLYVKPISVDGTEGKLVILVASSSMGEGSKELGEILIKGFIYSLTELPSPPAVLLFLNSGAYLTSEGANTVSDLKRLEEQGTKILTCGTCANYYGLTDKLAVGKITDMYGITEEMASATQVISI